MSSEKLPVAKVDVGAPDWWVFETPSEGAGVELGVPRLQHRDLSRQMLEQI
jgi:hypothetical protein